MEHMDTVSPYLTKGEAAKYLRMSERWLDEQMASSNPPPSISTGKKYMFKPPELEVWFEEKFRRGQFGASGDTVELRDSFGESHGSDDEGS